MEDASDEEKCEENEEEKKEEEVREMVEKGEEKVTQEKVTKEEDDAKTEEESGSEEDEEETKSGESEKALNEEEEAAKAQPQQPSQKPEATLGRRVSPRSQAAKKGIEKGKEESSKVTIEKSPLKPKKDQPPVVPISKRKLELQDESTEEESEEETVSSESIESDEPIQPSTVELSATKSKKEPAKPQVPARAAPAKPEKTEASGQTERVKLMDKRKLVPLYALNENTLEDLGLKDEVLQYFENIGWMKALQWEDKAYKELSCEFLLLYSFKPTKGYLLNTPVVIKFAIQGTKYSMFITELNLYLGIVGVSDLQKQWYKDAKTLASESWTKSIQRRWEEIGGIDPFKSGTSKSREIKNAALQIYHKWIAYNIYANKDGTGQVTQ
ncbi:hypothetical protein C2S53_007827 [Perilla frutescens var. hirtella]|uniref:Arabidopsis retrotransposon Orf1 C-terminal domain-containing protein n=1 Tax=Perilla frutescens var. hirtella TaxID=608512 RepID=A0AAD4JMU4_PERFH|nr:hypothetical protein C2S53_007827 [Perilla frutescens var. hirtella]